MVVGGRGVLGREILVQRAAERGVDELNAPADAKNRLICLQSFPQHNLLQRIPFRAVRDEPLQRLLTVNLRRHIVSAGEEEAIAEPTELDQILLIRCEREDQREPARLPDSLQIAGQYPEAFFLVISQRRHANDRFHHKSLLKKKCRQRSRQASLSA